MNNAFSKFRTNQRTGRPSPPLTSGVTTDSAASSMVISTVAKSRIIHKVESGEHLTLIAQKYGTSIQNIKDWNGLKSDLIRAGQHLIVSASSKNDSTSQRNGYVVAVDALRVRSEPSTSAAVKGYVHKGQSLNVVAEEYSGWYKILHNGSCGYVAKQYVKQNI
jgi:LysM repeat protein